MAPPMPPAPARGLLLLLAPLAGQLQRGSRAGAGRRSRAGGWRVGRAETVLRAGLGRTGVDVRTPGHYRYARTGQMGHCGMIE